jgi:Protein of unknown function (DUF2892)
MLESAKSTEIALKPLSYGGLTKIKPAALARSSMQPFRWDFAMTRNIGRIDQFLRIIVGFALLAYTVKDGTLEPGWLGVGALGLVLVVTAFFSYSPLYTLFGINTRHQRSSA